MLFSWSWPPVHLLGKLWEEEALWPQILDVFMSLFAVTPRKQTESGTLGALRRNCPWCSLTWLSWYLHLFWSQVYDALQWWFSYATRRQMSVRLFHLKTWDRAKLAWGNHRIFEKRLLPGASFFSMIQDSFRRCLWSGKPTGKSRNRVCLLEYLCVRSSLVNMFSHLWVICSFSHLNGSWACFGCFCSTTLLGKQSWVLHMISGFIDTWAYILVQ